MNDLLSNIDPRTLLDILPPMCCMRKSRRASLTTCQAGLNLNIFGAISGAFSGKSKKQQQKDGTTTEDREEHAHIRGAGMGNASAAGAASAEAKAREEREAILAKK